MSFKILFVGVGNTCRTPIAEAFARKLGMRAESAGTMPGRAVTAAAVAAMQAKGIDISNHKPKRFELARASDFDRVVLIGEDVHPTHPGLERFECWRMRDIVGQPLRSYEEARDALERRIHELQDELNEWQRA